jgi:hypothetical protein
VQRYRKGACRVVKEPDTSSGKHEDSPQVTQVQHPKRGAIPSPISDIEKAPIFTPKGSEVEEQTSQAQELDAPERKG